MVSDVKLEMIQKILDDYATQCEITEKKRIELRKPPGTSIAQELDLSNESWAECRIAITQIGRVIKA